MPALLSPRNNTARLTTAERRQLQHVIAHHGGWVGAARILGVSVSTVMALEAEYGSAQATAVERCREGLKKAGAAMARDPSPQEDLARDRNSGSIGGEGAMSPKRFALLVLRDTTIWIAIACTQALSADEAEEMAAEEAEMLAEIEERLRWS